MDQTENQLNMFGVKTLFEKPGCNLGNLWNQFEWGKEDI